MSTTYRKVSVSLEPFEPWNEVIIAQLAELPFESFEEDAPLIHAYIPEEDFNANDVEMIFSSIQNQDVTFSMTSEIIAPENWNAVWESQFEPVTVGNKLVIKASFHELETAFDHTVIIEPKMSFGTGHHQTTFLMCSELLEHPPIGKKVLDMGAGTGVLAILAEKLGATNILAVEIEPWSAENCAENAEKNTCSNITSLCGDVDLIRGKSFDLILANINKNVLKSQFSDYADGLVSGGKLMISGFFTSDNEELMAVAQQLNLKVASILEKEGWSMISFLKP